MFKMQCQTFANACSVTARVFIKAEHAENHCQISNIGLALDVMIQWMREKSQRSYICSAPQSTRLSLDSLQDSAHPDFADSQVPGQISLASETAVS